MLFPLGVIGATATFLAGAGALLTVFVVITIFLFGLSAWARTKIAEYGYSKAIWQLEKGKIVGLYILGAVGVGAVFGLMGAMTAIRLGMDVALTTAATAGAGALLGFLWGFVEKKRGAPGAEEVRKWRKMIGQEVATIEKYGKALEDIEMKLDELAKRTAGKKLTPAEKQLLATLTARKEELLEMIKLEKERAEAVMEG